MKERGATTYFSYACGVQLPQPDSMTTGRYAVGCTGYSYGYETGRNGSQINWLRRWDNTSLNTSINLTFLALVIHLNLCPLYKKVKEAFLTT